MAQHRPDLQLGPGQFWHGGKLYDTFNTQIVSILTMTLSSFTVLMIPLSGYLAVAHGMVFFEGLSLGAFATGANVWNIRMWPDNSSPALQAFHLAFGIGGLVAPFIARPFLSPVPGGNSSGTPNHTIRIAEQIYLTSSHGSELSDEMLELERVDERGSGKSQVHYAFAIASALNVLLVISMVVLYFVDRSDFKPEDPTSNTSATDRSANDVRFTRIMLTFLCVYSFIYVTLECTSSEMFAPFAVKGALRFSKDAASRVVAVFFFCFSAGRLTGVLFTIKVPVFWLIAASHVVLLPTEVMLATWGSSIPAVLWAGSALAGFAQGPLNAGVTAWTAKYITITNKMMSLVIVMGCLGSMTPPLFVGQFIESRPDVFLYVCLAAASLCAAFFVTVCVYVRITTRYDESRALLINATDGDTPGDVPSPPVSF
ncbi:sodium-dependent glucose transporter 1C isoform X2 [Rhipicephalus sanguineus]|uniref:sodium-dependent glucose transporter 1C isoform X2 n=1 Tax=Rhipicephalus sanguineus TaxID=34632 RepID=UPI001895A829|nr:sodium-dependent glucose transporter 1C isoform X2 [Rhipicephalus sanguineus]